MEINIHQIPEAGLDIETSLPAETLDIVDRERLLSTTPVICDLNASISHDDLVVRGEATVVLECRCDRCLENTEIEVHVEDICIVVKNTPDIVDLTNDIREDIILAFPQLYLCNKECKGLCTQCGKNLNKGKCQCNFDQEESSPWDTLDDLNFKDSSGE